MVTELGSKADPDKDVIRVDGKLIRPVRSKRYILLNKPPGYTSTRSDPHAEHTILELIGDTDQYLYPIGRLDVDTAGLLILTNDGELTHLLTHPSHEIEKTYLAVVRGRVSSSALSRLAKGVELEDGMTAPARARLISYSVAKDESKVEIIIHEGRKRQVRRMFDAIGNRVIALTRTRIGTIDLKGLDEGKYRELTPKEVLSLMRMAKCINTSDRSSTGKNPGQHIESSQRVR